MSTTQMSESMNAFFDGYANSRTSLKQFVEQYEMEKQLQSAYIISKFRECQEEFTGMMYCQVIYTDEASMEMTYDVQEVVMGILCRHAISILVRNDVTTLPEMYILRRWQKDVRRAHSRVAINYDGWVSTLEQRKYDEMRKAFDKVADLTTNSESRT
ncbi:protein FAR1-RELATED SEQUENCE 4-like [Diospyros lotus]|uniref:protein FAR1-RELATED SEQUENCE 4-like n=1 Tax=Diospyros lotus TaxID=55363 RepID=UPI002255E3B1|nr:protein FAR1-RELATED SEQUENCE 4-like [Diospyros lotus]